MPANHNRGRQASHNSPNQGPVVPYTSAVSTERFLEGLVAEAQVEAEHFDRPGTSIVNREVRAGSGVVSVYWVGDHTLVWADPEKIELLSELEDRNHSTSANEIANRMAALGFNLEATADMRVLNGPPMKPPALPKGYVQRWLRADQPSDVDLVRAFADRSDPVDVEEAALDELDDFAETAINVVTTDVPEEADRLLAYGSACDWDWDPLLADIGVLVDPGHRRVGLGRYVVAHTAAQLVKEGRVPLYRHGHHNIGSQSIAVGLGFEVVASLSFFTS